MKKRLIFMASAALLSTTLFLTSCAEGNNGDMPPESTTGDTQETGVEGTGYVPEEEDTAVVSDVNIDSTTTEQQ